MTPAAKPATASSCANNATPGRRIASDQRRTDPCAEASALTERSAREAWAEPFAEASAERVAAAALPLPATLFDGGVGAAVGAVVAGAVGVAAAAGVTGALVELAPDASVLRCNAPPACDMAPALSERSVAPRDAAALPEALPLTTPPSSLPRARVALNAWIDETRARERRSQTFVAEDEGEQVGVSTTDAQIDAIAVRKAVAQLGDDQRAVVGLVLVEGLPYKEEAEVLGVPIGTLTSRLARARETLQALLGGVEGVRA